ncbi:unnamed protein product [Cunninghamella blakesleeana]
MSNKLKLRIGVLAAKDLFPADKTGFSDPYAVIRINGKKYTTGVVKQNLNPTWNFEFDISLSHNKIPNLINITVWDKDMIGRDFLGEVSIPFKNIFDRNNGGSIDGCARHYSDPENQSAWYTLNKRMEKNNVSGDISLKFGFHEETIRNCEQYMEAWDTLVL